MKREEKIFSFFVKKIIEMLYNSNIMLTFVSQLRKKVH